MNGDEPETAPISILLVDDHVVVRQGLKMVISLEPDFEVAGEASDGEEAVAAAHELQPDVVLMDLLMPVMNGVEAIRRLKEELPEIEIVALTSVLEDRLVVEAVEADAMGYLLKETSPEVLFEAIRAAPRRDVRLDPRARKRLLHEVRTPELREFLTARETDSLRLLARGLANREIAEELGVSEMTVKTHVSSVLSKLHLKSRSQGRCSPCAKGLSDWSEFPLSHVPFFR